MSESKRREQRKTFVDCDGVEVEYRSTPFSGDKAYDLLPEVLNLVAGPIGGLLGALGGGQTQNIDGRALIFGISALATALKDIKKRKIINDIVASTYRVCPETSELKRIDDKAVFAEVYQANLYEFFRALIWVVEINFAPFLREQLEPMIKKIKNSPKLKGLLSELQEAQASQSETGSSGE